MPNTQTHTPEHDSASKRQVSTTASMRPFSNILCAVDGTQWSDAAVEMAASLAGPDGHLTLLAVTAVTGPGPHASADISPGRADQLMSRAQRIAEDAGVPSTPVVDPSGPPVDVILGRASDHDLLALGAPAMSRLAGILVGGVAAPALGRFTTPMLLARGAGALQGRRILVASDGEEGSEQIVELAGRLGQSQGAQVTLVNAIGAESKINPLAIQAQARALAHVLPDAGEPHIEPGKPWDVILGAARSTDAAMVVIGSRRLHGLRAFGSVSRRVAHDAPCSVLVIPPRRP